ncbi:AAA family ATPase [Robertmurraya kyonggiensis]|nr:SMC family ATPase [Robertmurraya kyonggiensis]
MRIKSVVLENFRCYYGKHSFTLDNGIIVLFGENGFGKSSFFDAIEWCLTGAINRFISTDKKILYNFYSKLGDNCSVSIEFDNGNTLIRSFKIQENMRETIKLISSKGGVIKTGQSCLEDFIDTNIDGKNNKKEFVETTSLVKQALILSQDQVTDFILRDDPNERFNALVDIMGYKKWTMIINNLKKVNDKIKVKIRDDQSQINTYEKLMSEKEKEKQEVDIYIVNELLRKYNLTLNKETPSQITELKDSIKKELVLYGKNLNELSRLLHLRNSNYFDIEVEANSIKSSLNNAYSLREKGLGLSSKIMNKKEDVTKVLSSVKREVKILNEKKKIEEDIKLIIQEVGEDLTYYQDNIDKIELEIKRFENELSKVRLAAGEYNNYIVHKDTIKKIPLIIVGQEFEIHKITKELKLIEKKINKFDDIINSKQANSQLNKLNNSIQEIYNYVLENEIEDTCPVCSTNNSGNLQSHIYSNIKNNLELIVKDSSTLNKAVNRRNELKGSYEKKSGLVRNLLKKLERNREELRYSEKMISELQENELYSEVLFESEKEFLREKSEKIGDEISKLNQKKFQIFELEKLNVQYMQFEHIKNIDIEDSDSLNKEIFKLDKYLRWISDVIKKINESIETLSTEHASKMNDLSLWKNLIGESNNSIKLIEVYNHRNNTITNLDNKLEEVYRLENFLKTVQENEDKNNLINQYKSDMKILRSNISKLINKQNEITKFIDNAYNKIGSQALEYFNQQDSSIQKYFRYLNPMPTSNKVIFKSENKDELELIMSVEGEDGDYTDLSNVQYSMSSGQLNVLAISLFLAINEGQTLSKLDLIGIDDPIQNMDDVNQFSICDVFSNIRKQLILSTHDYDFLKLFIKKNEHRVNDIKVFMLESDRFANTLVKEVTF